MKKINSGKKNSGNNGSPRISMVVEPNEVEITAADRDTYEKLLSSQLWVEQGKAIPSTVGNILKTSSLDDDISAFSEQDSWSEVEAAFSELSQKTAEIVDLRENRREAHLDAGGSDERISNPGEVEESSNRGELSQGDIVEIDPIGKNAPWVGAEKSWREGTPPQPTEKVSQPEYAARLDDTFKRLALSSEELQTVRTSLPPPADETSAPNRMSVWKAVSFAAMLLLSVTVTWNVAQFLQNSPNNDDVTVTPQLGVQQPDYTLTASSSNNSSDADSVANANAEETEDWFNEGFELSHEEPRAVKKYNSGRRGVGARSATLLSSSAGAGVESGNEIASAPVADAAGEVAASETVDSSLNTEAEEIVVPAELDGSPSEAAVSAGATATDGESSDTISLADSEPAPDGPDAVSVAALHEMLKSVDVSEKSKDARDEAALPSKESISTAMSHILPSVKKCKMGEGGRLVVKLVVSGATGRVVSAQTVDNTFSATSTGLCAARAVRVAKFPSFKKEKLIIKYPFDI